MKLKYRLALDMGANSLGWCVYLLDDKDEPCAIKRLGSRIFSDGRDPKTLASLAADRRLARQARRRRDRVLKRRQRLMQGLIDFGLMPSDEAGRKALQSADPYALRARGLDQPLTPHELGRAIYHLARKRGFRSSRKDARNEESKKETGKVDTAIKALRERITAANCRTVGEYLAKQHADRLPVRARRSSDGQYVLYLQRGMVEEEFDLLWDVQRKHHPHLLTDEAREYLKNTILFQRRLLPVKPGHCLFEQAEYRAPLCSPLQQRFRLLQELNNLRVKDGVAYRVLTLDERNRMLDQLVRPEVMSEKGAMLTFAKLAKAAGLGKASAFNLESEKRRGLKGDTTTAQFAAPAALGETWHGLDLNTREGLALLVERADQESSLREALLALPGDLAMAKYVMRQHEHEEVFLAALARLPNPLTETQTQAISRTHLPEDFGSLSRKALLRIIPELERDVITYDVAVKLAGYLQQHSGEIFQRLPYYGEILRGYTSPADKAKDDDERQYGKIPNPTVHIGLNQLRQLVNALIKRYGPPHQIVIELTREFGVSGEHRREIEKQQAENQKRNEDYNAALEKMGVPANRVNRLKLQLWKELGSEDAMDRECIYSGKRIGPTILFSDEIEIDHILPFSRSLHDGTGNKILCVREANRFKSNHTPFEAFGHSPGHYQWDDIRARVERVFASSKSPALRRKAELFKPDALESFLDGKDFLARHLTDTAYLGRVAKQYLSYICHKDYVWVSSGKLTGMLRGKWGLNPLLSEDTRKNREDHRHHALDAAVIGMCSRSLIQHMSNAAARAEELGENRLLKGLELPWPMFREELRESLVKVVVSHKPEHGTEGALHKQGNYARRTDTGNSVEDFYSAHVPIESINYGNVVSSEGRRGRPSPKVRDPALRNQLAALLENKTDKQVAHALAEFSQQTGIKRVQLQQRLGTAIPICRKNGDVYRYVVPDENYCRDVVRDEKGRWRSENVNSFDANRSDFEPSNLISLSEKPVIMRIRKGDMMIIEEGEKRRVMRVASFTNDGFALAEHREANTADRDGKVASGFSYIRVNPEPLRKLKARIVGVDILGFVNDPGFHE